MGSNHHSKHQYTDEIHFCVITVSSSRNENTDETGEFLVSILSKDHIVTGNYIVRDDIEEIQRLLEEHLNETDVMVVNGGSGITQDDLTPEAIRPLMDKEIPGFGEHFRRLSIEDVGEKGMISRATAGIIDETVVFLIPGNPDAAILAAEKCILPEIRHILGLIR